VSDRIVFYSHNGFGLGHVRRNFLIARALREAVPGADIILVTGSPFPQDPALEEGMDYVRLPAFLRDGTNHWSPKQLRGFAFDDLTSLRADTIHSVIRRFRPSLLVADHLPAGVGGELLPALECLRESGGRAVAGFRDILDTADRVRRTWQENRTVFVLREYYAKTLVYGSPDVFDFRQYDLPADLQSRLVYCGYLGRPAVPSEALEEARALLRGGRERSVLACAGGGIDGLGVIKAAVTAGPHLEYCLRARLVAVAGPLMSSTDWRELRAIAHRRRIDLRQSIDGFPAHVAASDLLIGMCGYNTACEALSYGVPFLAVPRAEPSTEQLIRARAFSKLGLLTCLEPGRLAAGTLVEAATATLSEGPRGRVQLPMDGVSRARDILRDML